MTSTFLNISSIGGGCMVDGLILIESSQGTWLLSIDCTSLTLLVLNRYFPSRIISPPSATPKSYHSFLLLSTLNDAVLSDLNGDLNQYCPPYDLVGWYPNCLRYSTMLICFASSIFISIRFSPTYIYTKTKLNCFLSREVLYQICILVLPWLERLYWTRTCRVWQ